MTPEELNTIEKRANDASDGPWKFEYEWVDTSALDPTASYVVHGPLETVVDIGYEEDAVFIAHAREDVPALIAEVRRLWLRVREPALDV